jgi:hypothetical protein
MANVASGPPHERATYFDAAAGRWRYVGPERDRSSSSPTLPEVLRDKLGEHGVNAVVEIIGLSRNTVLSIAASAPHHPSSAFVAQARLSDCARLDSASDSRARIARATR